MDELRLAAALEQKVLCRLCFIVSHCTMVSIEQTSASLYSPSSLPKSATEASLLDLNNEITVSDDNAPQELLSPRTAEQPSMIVHVPTPASLTRFSLADWR